MNKGLNILIVGEYRDALSQLEILLNPVQELVCRSVVVSFSSIRQVLQRADQQEEATDVVIIRLSENPEALLEPLKHRNFRNIKILVQGPMDNVRLMRTAMQAGVYDYLGEEGSDAELMRALQGIFQEKLRLPKGRLTAVIPMSGGVGGSFIAANLACVMAENNAKSLLLDMDLMRGSTLQMLDLKSTYGLEDVFEQLDSLDFAALEGLLTRHENGLSVLAANHMNLLTGEKPGAEQLLHLLGLLKDYAREVVVDLPMTPVSVSSVILQQADVVCLVVQQEMVVLRNALYWMDLSEKEWGIPRDRFMIVVNSYSKGLDIDLDDIRKILGTENIVGIPHDYIKVTHSINAGLPITQHAPNASVAKAIVNLHTHFNPVTETVSGIKKLASKLFRRA